MGEAITWLDCETEIEARMKLVTELKCRVYVTLIRIFDGISTVKNGRTKLTNFMHCISVEQLSTIRYVLVVNNYYQG